MDNKKNLFLKINKQELKMSKTLKIKYQNKQT